MSHALIYAYGVVGTPVPEQTLSVLGESLFNYSCSDRIVVICRRVDADTFGEEALERQAQDTDWLEGQARHHMWVLNTLLDQGPVVPFRFPTLYYSLVSLTDAIAAVSTSLAASLDRVRGCREWEIAFSADPLQLEASAASMNTELVTLDAEIARSGNGRAYLLGKKRADLMASVVRDFFSEQVERIMAEPAALGITCKPFSGIGSQQSPVSIKKACLIPETLQQKVASHLKAHQAKLGKMGITYTIRGPWPPFSFV